MPEYLDVHVVCDNYGTHKTPTINAASWLHLVDVWFGILERQAIHRGTFTSVRDLTTKIRTFINSWNDGCPFILAKTADQIRAKANRPDNPTTAH